MHLVVKSVQVLSKGICFIWDSMEYELLFVEQKTPERFPLHVGCHGIDESNGNGFQRTWKKLASPLRVRV